MEEMSRSDKGKIPPTVWGECHEVTKGDGLRERTARVAGEEPPQVKEM